LGDGAKYYGRSVSLDLLRNKSQYGKEGVSMLGLPDAAEPIELKPVGAKLTVEQFITDAPLPQSSIQASCFANFL